MQGRTVIDGGGGRSRWRTFACLLLVTVALSGAQRVLAQEVGAVAHREGSAEIGRAGVWSAAELGATVQLGDKLRTGTPGRLRVLLRDQTVLNLGDDTELVIDRQVFDPDQNTYQSFFSLLQGKVRAVVSDFYREPEASFEIRTNAAVAGVRGTEFVMTHDPASETSEVVGITDSVEVHGIRDRKRSVYVTTQELTRVVRGEAPSPARRIDDELFRQYLEGLQLGGAGAEGIAASSPVVRGLAVGEANRASVLRALRRRPIQRRPLIITDPEDRFIGPDPATLLGQSPPVLKRVLGAGGIGIEF